MKNQISIAQLLVISANMFLAMYYLITDNILKAIYSLLMAITLCLLFIITRA